MPVRKIRFSGDTQKPRPPVKKLVRKIRLSGKWGLSLDELLKINLSANELKLLFKIFTIGAREWSKPISQDELQKAIGCKKTALNKAIQSLLKREWIESKSAGWGESNQYRIRENALMFRVHEL